MATSILPKPLRDRQIAIWRSLLSVKLASQVALQLEALLLSTPPQLLSFIDEAGNEHHY